MTSSTSSATQVSFRKRRRRCHETRHLEPSSTSVNSDLDKMDLDVRTEEDGKVPDIRFLL